MIDKSKQNTTLKVCLDDAGTHNRAILDFFFAKLGQHIFRCVDTQEEANVLLIDYDFPPARQRFETEYQQWQKPALVLSISEVTLENSIWLAKPLTSRALLDAAETLQQQLASSPQLVGTHEAAASQKVSDSTAFVPTSNTILQRPPLQEFSQPANLPLIDKPDIKATVSETDADLPSTQSVSEAVDTSVSNDNQVASDDSKLNSDLDSAASSVSATENTDTANEVTEESKQIESAERVLRLCGNNKDISADTNINDFQKDDTFFLSSLKDAVRLARQCQQGVLLNFPQARIYVLPEIHRIFCGIDIYDDEFTELIDTCNVREGGKMHILSTREIHELNDMISQQASALYDLEAFVWTSTLLSAAGSLPRALDPKSLVGLKHWPSLTRLENFPHVMPIAAQWSDKAMSAFDVAKTLDIPQRYVFSFYNAASSLGLIEQDPEKLINKQSVPRTRSKDAPSGLFSRLLKRLVGG